MFHKTKNTSYLFYYAVLGLAPVFEQAHAMDDQAVEVYRKAIQISPLVKKMHEDGLKRRQEEEHQLTIILNNISNNPTTDSEKLRDSVIASLKSDKIVFAAVDVELKRKDDLGQEIYQPGKKGTTYQLRNNKMVVITSEALKLAENKEFFFDILDGKLPHGYSIMAPEFNFFPEKTNIYSNGKRGNALKSLLLKIWQIQNDKSELHEITELFDPSWLDTSPFVHITPLPEDFIIPSLESSSHFFKDEQTPKALLTINNGYAFGGHRNEERYRKGKEWGPQDCSSFTALYTGCKTAFSTLHQAQYFQEINGFQFKERVSEDIVNKWEAGKEQRQNDTCIKMMSEVLTPLGPNLNPQSQLLKPGLVHAERYYTGLTKDEKVSLNGTGGHTGIFLGTIGSEAETQALTLSANRDLEKSGREFIYGVEKRTFFTIPEHMVMFFEVKEQ